LQLSFFTEKVEERFDESKKKLEPKEFEEIIEEYFKRFDSELEQIQLKTQVNKKRQNQHSNRESIIRMTLENETKNFSQGGIELPDLTNEIIFKKFRNWDGSSHSIQHIEMRFISKSFLEKLAKEQEKESTMNVE
jgi:translation machinery-associated protein 16